MLLSDDDAKDKLRRMGLHVPDNVEPAKPLSGCAGCDGDDDDDIVWWMLWSGDMCEAHIDQHLRRFAQRQLGRTIPARQLHARDIPDALSKWDATNEQGQGVFMYGPVQTGKSYTAAALAKRAWLQLAKREHRGTNVRWVNIAEWFTETRLTMSRTTKPADLATVHDMIEADILILDDIGAERQSSWVVETLYVVINGRYDRRRPTIATSNLDLAQLAQSLTPIDDNDSVSGERIVRRLHETCLSVAMTKRVEP